jgi:DNA-binding YbaB/EbfC family protein
MLDQAKALMKMKKLQKELAQTIIEVDAGDGAVVVRINGEQKIKGVSIDPDSIDLEDIEQLESWVQEAFKKAVEESQKIAQEKMKPMLGNLGNLGL